MLRLVVPLLAVLFAPLMVQAENLKSLIGGNPRVVDGDTLVFSGVPGKTIRVRMEGIVRWSHYL